MAIDLEEIERICGELWELIDELRNLIVTYKRADRLLTLTPEQEQALKNEFNLIKKNIQDKAAELP